MSRNRFARSLVFAALAAAGWPAFGLLTAPLLGNASAFALYIVGVSALYLLGIAPRPGRGRLAAITALGLGAPLAALAHGPVELAIACAALIGALRSGWLYRARSARALATEVALLAGGLALARVLATPGPLGTALALWGFFLVQSLYFLVGGLAARRADAGSLDPFELARSRLAALLEE